MNTTTTKYPRTYHLPFSEGLSNDDKKVEADWWKHLEGRELVLTEKLDGQNNSIFCNGVFARSHSTPTTHPWDKYLSEPGSIYELAKYFLTEDEGIYGESLYAVHSIEYNNLPTYFFMFAARNSNGWYSWNEVCELSEMLNIPTVPVLERRIFDSPKDLENTIKKHMQNGSAFGDTIEGIVVRTADGFAFEDFSKYVVKYVRKNHVQTDIHWTKSCKRAKLNYEQ